MKNERKHRVSISNALMFAMVMRDPELCAETLNRIIPGKRVEAIRMEQMEDLQTEETIIAAIRSKGVRLDVRFTDSENWYVLEMQVRDEKNVPERSRYIHSTIDVDGLNRGQKYTELKNSYVIFLCRFDPFGLGRTRYCFQTMDTENNLSLGDNRYTIVVNTRSVEVEISGELRALIDYIEKDVITEGDSFIQDLDECVESLNEGKVGDVIMTLQEHMEISERLAIEQGLKEGREKGLKEGLKEGRKAILVELVQKGKLTVEEAAEMLGIDAGEMKESLQEY